MKANKKTIWIIVASLLAVICMAISGIIYSNKIEVRADFSGVSLKDEYFVGETIEIPSATFTVDGTTVDADFKVVFPDNSTYTSSKIKVTDYGYYTVRYFATINKKKYEEVKTFKVNMKLYEIDGTGSASYGTYSIRNDYMEEHKNDFMSTTAERDKIVALQNNNYVESMDGVKVALGAGSTFKYNKVIDLKELESENPLISLQITPTEKGITDFRRLNIKLTDVYDDSNYVLIRMKDKENDDGEYLSYCFCSIKNDYRYYRGTARQANAVYGLSVRSSFRGLPGLKNNAQVNKHNTYYADDYISFYFDETSNCVYKTDSSNREVNTTTLLCDLLAVNAGFDGFTTGEVKMEIYCEMYSSTYANFLIRGIANDNLSAIDKVVDTEGPKVSVDFNGLDEANLPNGSVGMPFKVFNASAYDLVDGFTTVNTYVYRNFYTSNRLSVPVINGKFYPDSAGIYTICYRAIDKFLNESEYLVDIEVVDEDRPITFELSNRANDEATKQGIIEELAIAKKIDGSFGGFGVVNVGVQILDASNNVVYSFSDATVPHEVRLLKMGIYTVRYTATDYVEQTKIIDYKLVITKNDGSVIITDVDSELPDNFILGYTYKLPKAIAYNFNNDGTYSEVDAPVTVSNGNGTVSNGVYTPKNAGDVVFKYAYKDASEIVSRKVYSISKYVKLEKNKKPKNVSDELYDSLTATELSEAEYETLPDKLSKSVYKKQLDINKMFIATSGNIESSYTTGDTYNYAKYTMNNDASMTFINTLLAENFSLTFNGDLSKPDIELINIYLTDSKNADEQVLLTFSRADAKFYFGINGGTKTKLNTTFTGLKSADYKLNVTASSGDIIADNIKFNILKYLNGEPYAGFSSGNIKLKIEFKLNEKRPNGFTFIIKNLTGVIFADSNISDKSQPNIVSLSDFGGTKALNSEYTLPEVLAGDVISPELKDFTVSVKAPDGTVLYNNAPVDRYKFVLDQHGIYAISYRATDQSNNVKEFSFSIHVLDMEAPKVELQKHKEKGKVNKEIKVAPIIVSDNYCESDTIITYIYVSNPYGKLIHITNTNPLTKIKDVDSDLSKATFIPEVAGTYTVYYMVYDSSTDGISQGNATILSYTIEVK